MLIVTETPSAFRHHIFSKVFYSLIEMIRKNTQQRLSVTVQNEEYEFWFADFHIFTKLTYCYLSFIHLW